MKNSPILVYSANGVQGGAVVKQALKRGHRVRALVRNSTKSEALRATGAEVVVAAFEDKTALNNAHKGIDYVVLQIPLGDPARMEPLVMNAIEAIQSNGVKGVIAKTGAGKPSIGSEVPAFVLNDIIESKLRDSKVPFAMVRPTMYLENFLRPDAIAEISNHNKISYSLAADRKIAWTSVEDLATATLILLESGTFDGDYSIAGAKAVQGDELAGAFSNALQ